MTTVLRRCRVPMFGKEAGILRETEAGYVSSRTKTRIRTTPTLALSASDCRYAANLSFVRPFTRSSTV
jgi:hypothetical protein